MRPETRLQRDIRHYLQLNGYKVVHVPNGATLSGTRKQRAIQMANLKRDGLCVGFPDLIVYASNGRIGHIEVKTETGTQSANQKTVQQWMDEMAHQYAVCRSLEDVKATLAKWGWA